MAKRIVLLSMTKRRAIKIKWTNINLEVNQERVGNRQMLMEYQK